MTNTSNKVKTMVIAALLCTIGIIIPMYSPVKILIEPASFTLASHVPIFIAMFISPPVALAVALLTAFGFLFAAFPIIVVFRAMTHIVFATVGSFILKKNGNVLSSFGGTALFSTLMAVIHAICEVLVVTYFYWGNSMTSANYDKGYLVAVLGLVGVGTLIHSTIDFTIAYFIWKPIQNIVNVPVSVRLKRAKLS